MSNCPDCAVPAGIAHEQGCDVARCLTTGGQRISCDDSRGCGYDIWTGQWPGDVECEEFGWWVRRTTNGWTRCAADHPDATHDLNRLDLDARWDREQARWVLR